MLCVPWYNENMQKDLLQWYDNEKRDLPWRRVSDPYAIWLSEIMLQQTRVETVVSYWTRFLSLFPTVQALAEASEQSVLKAWEGLGYYSRARNMKRCAMVVMERHGGLFPRDVKALGNLPGIGPYTAGAVASIAFGVQTPAVDGNVERVISRLCGIREDVTIPSVKRNMFNEAASLVPADRPGDFNQAMMELGARVCQPVPRCAGCPMQPHCDAYAAGDADALPVKQKKAPPKELTRGVALVFYQGRVLLQKRQERLLQGLWCFPGFDGLALGPEVESRLRALGISARYVACAGGARHVFTHIVWDMILLRFDAESPHCPEGWQWADGDALAKLPLPTAVKAAKAFAVQTLREINFPLV